MAQSSRMNEIDVYELPNDSMELRYYVEHHTINVLTPNQYFINDMCLYSRYQDRYIGYDLEPIRYQRIPLRLDDNTIVLAEIELVLNPSYQEQKYIDELMKKVRKKEGARMYFIEHEYDMSDDEVDDFMRC